MDQNTLDINNIIRNTRAQLFEYVDVEMPDGSVYTCTAVQHVHINELNDLPVAVRASLLFTDDELEQAIKASRELKIQKVLAVFKRGLRFRDTNELVPFTVKGYFSYIKIPFDWSSLRRQLNNGTIGRYHLKALYDLVTSGEFKNAE